MKKTLVTLFALCPLAALAHPGHPAPADHGDLAHVLWGVALTLPVLAITWLLLRARNRRLAAKVNILSKTRQG